MSDPRVGHVAANLLRPSPLQSEGFRHGDLAERMACWGVPGVSVAVIEDQKLAWATAWGIRKAGAADPCTVDTLFQVASLSKPVTALITLRLVQQGLLDLDADVSTYLKRWQIPANGSWRPRVTLRHLLSHTAGFTPSGFPGYRSGAPVPSLISLLNGEGNTERAQVVALPGLTFRYSGAGTCIVQKLLEDVTGQPFAELADNLIFRPLGMPDSTFAQPLPAARHAQAAAGHRMGGDPIQGNWHVYPEQAAAGLWSTPSELALLVLEIQRIRTGRGGTLLGSELINEMLSPQFGTNSGLGFFVEGSGDMLRFDHSGDNEGFKAFLLAYANQGKAAIICANGDGGTELNIELLRSIASEYGWPKDPSYHWFWNEPPATAWQPTAEMLADYPGDYEARAGLRFSIHVRGQQLFFTVTGQDPVPLQPVAPDRFRALCVNAEVSFGIGGQTMSARLNGVNISCQRVERLEELLGNGRNLTNTTEA